jgi:hypothetical protein
MSIINYRGERLDARTIAMFEEAERLFGQPLHIIQGGYNVGGVAASAGTHDRAALDIRTRDFTTAERDKLVLVFRQVGFAAWLRTVAQGFDGPHLHAIPIDGDVSAGAEDQVDQYKAGRNGLARRGPDDGPAGYRSMTWEKYKAAHTPTGNTSNPPEENDMTPAQAVEMLTLLRSIATNLSGINARLGYVANDGMKDLDALRDKIAGND